MYIFEGRGHGATWSLLLETLHNQGVYVTPKNASAVKNIKKYTLKNMYTQGVISLDGLSYLEENIFSIEEWKKSGRRQERTKIYFDIALAILADTLHQELGTLPEIIALGNDDMQIVKPKQIKEMNNSYICDQREYYGRE